MRGKILFVVGLAAGYVVGARAGRPAYDALTERLSGTRDNPTVHRIGEKAKTALEDKAPKVADVAEKAASAVQGAAAAAADPDSAKEEDSEDGASTDAAKPTDTAKPAGDAKPGDAASPGVEDDGATDAPTPTPPSSRSKKPSGSTPSAA